MSTQIEEGELPEEGEIMEEDEEDSYKCGTITHDNVESTANTVANLAVSTKSSTPAIGMSSKKNFTLIPAQNLSTNPESHNVSSSFARVSPGYRDYDGKNAREDAHLQNAMLSSWMNGVSKKGGGSSTSKILMSVAQISSVRSTSSTSSLKIATSPNVVTSSESETTLPSQDRDFRRRSTAFEDQGEIFDDDDVEEGEMKERKSSTHKKLKQSTNKREDFASGDDDFDYREQIRRQLMIGGSEAMPSSASLGDGTSRMLAPGMDRRRRRSASPSSTTDQGGVLHESGAASLSTLGCGVPKPKDDDCRFFNKRQRFSDGGDEFDSPNSASSPPNNAFHGAHFNNIYNNNSYNQHGFRGGFRGSARGGGIMTRPSAPHWAKETICKFFREGYCRDGDECAYSHNAADSRRRPELCKFYQHGFCKKGMVCQHLHGEFPCKAFFKGECSKEPCQYSHQPLNEFTQPIFDQIMKDEELASRISMPLHPLRRKVLIPQGPESSESEHIPPPSIVVPVLASKPPPPAVMSSEEVTFGFFNPITPTSLSNGSSNVVKSESAMPIHPPPPILHPASVSSISGSIGLPLPTRPFLPPPAMMNTSSSLKGPQLPIVGLLDRGGNAHDNTAMSSMSMFGSDLFVGALSGKIHQSLSSSQQRVNSFDVSVPAQSSGSLNVKSDIDGESKSHIQQMPIIDSSMMMFGGDKKSDDEKNKNNNNNNDTSQQNSSSSMGDSGGSGGFNINEMLDNIITKQQVAEPSSFTSGLIDDSPASPPPSALLNNSFKSSLSGQRPKVIPTLVVRPWKLYPIHVDTLSEDIPVDFKLIQISSSSYRNDPRLRRLAERQFDLMTKKVEKQSAAAASNSIALPSGSLNAQMLSVSPANTSSSAQKLADPRSRDPRRKAPLFASLTSNSVGGSGSATDATLPVTSSSIVVGDFATSAASSNISSEEIFQKMIKQQIQMANKLATQQQQSGMPIMGDDVDHRMFGDGPIKLTGGEFDVNNIAQMNNKNPLIGFRGGGETGSVEGGFDVNSFTSNFIEMTSGSGGGTNVYNNLNDNYDFSGNDDMSPNDFASNCSDMRRPSHPSSATIGGGNHRRDRGGRLHGRGGNSRYDEQENVDHCHQQYHSHYDNVERRNNRGEREVGGSGRHRHKYESSSPPDSSSSSNNGGSTDQPSSVVSSTTTQPPQSQQPVVLSLREKRKNNEYESPLASRSAMSSRY